MYSGENRFDAITMYKEGTTAKDICDKFGISRSSLYYWVQQSGVDEYKRLSRDEYLLQAELKRLREENCIFRITGCTPSSCSCHRSYSI